MPRLDIHGHPVLSYETSQRDVYWGGVSKKIMAKYGKKKFTEHNEVEGILIFAFQYFINEFKKLVLSESRFTFFMYVFWLHEESLKLNLKLLGGQKLHSIDENEFARYRRILKAILEQGCDIDLEWGKFPDAAGLLVLDEKVQNLHYVGTWMYHLADAIALHKMIEECHAIEFDKDDMLVIPWQHHYGHAYDRLFPNLGPDYEKGTFDEQAIHELKDKINKCFSIDYDWAGGIIYEIKRYHNPKDPSLQTIEPYVLPKNLAEQFKISEGIANLYYDGLTISRYNKMSLEDLVLKPYSMNRFLFRPILVYRIGGVERALVGEDKFPESMLVLATNALNWNSLPEEWSQIPCMRTFLNQKANEHDKILEDKVEEAIIEKELLYVRNIKSFKRKQGNNVNIDNATCGEMDFVIVNPHIQTVFVVDCKYNKARYEAVGYRTDNTNFEKEYEPKMAKKLAWVSQNLNVLNEHLQIINNDDAIDVSSYEVDAVFFINTPTFYMFNGRYKAITLKQVSEFLDGKYEYPELFILDKDAEGNEIMGRVKHPYFKKPLIRTIDLGEEMEK